MGEDAAWTLLEERADREIEAERSAAAVRLSLIALSLLILATSAPLDGCGLGGPFYYSCSILLVASTVEIP